MSGVIGDGFCQLPDKNYGLGNFVAPDCNAAHRTHTRFEVADRYAAFILMVLDVMLSTN